MAWRVAREGTYPEGCEVLVRSAATPPSFTRDLDSITCGGWAATRGTVSPRRRVPASVQRRARGGGGEAQTDRRALETGDGKATRLGSLAGPGRTGALCRLENGWNGTTMRRTRVARRGTHPEGCEARVRPAASLPSFIRLGRRDDARWLGGDARSVSSRRARRRGPAAPRRGGVACRCRCRGLRVETVRCPFPRIRPHHVARHPRACRPTRGDHQRPCLGTMPRYGRGRGPRSSLARRDLLMIRVGRRLKRTGGPSRRAIVRRGNATCVRHRSEVKRRAVARMG